VLSKKTLSIAGLIGVGLFFVIYGFPQISVFNNVEAPPPKLDIAAYTEKLIENANNPADASSSLWPVKTVFPNAGALLPFNRIVAYYGNFYSKKMGVLGEYPQEKMLSMLKGEVEKWEEADPTTPVIPAIEYIAVVAQNHSAQDGKYILRMPANQIKKAIDLAQEIKGLVILDIQTGHSTVENEIPRLESYLALPNVMLALDPEFAMQEGRVPGTVIGSMDAKEINFAATYLANMVKKYNLPPKILIVHRFTRRMVTHYQEIRPLPEVQIVMDMDGWGPKTLKLDTYKSYIYAEPVQFTGFKLFYKNDLKAPSSGLYTPEEILKFRPKPVFIMYQ
jgi:hypothetical protein